MTWVAVEVGADPSVREAVAQWLVTQTGMALEERADGTLVSFALDVSAAEVLAREVRNRFEPGISSLVCRQLAEVDWTTAWRNGLGPRRVGSVVLVPSWIQYQPADGDRVVTVDPESAFGSGEHGSTRAALSLMQRWIKPGGTVIDLGSGSGILAISAAKLGSGRAYGVELDPEALPVAARNAERNGVADRVAFLEGDAGALALLLGPADLVVANILRNVNLTLLGTVRRALKPDGIAIFSGMEVGEADHFRAPLVAAGFDILNETHDDGWWAVAAARG